jgi:hypothetical protein
VATTPAWLQPHNAAFFGFCSPMDVSWGSTQPDPSMTAFAQVMAD